jgi:hypothetical protein
MPAARPFGKVIKNNIADPDLVQDLGPLSHTLRAHRSLLQSHVDHAAPPSALAEIKNPSAELNQLPNVRAGTRCLPLLLTSVRRGK